MQQQINNIFERGTLYCIGIGGLAFWLGNLIPLFGKTMMGLILGIMLRGMLFNKKSERGITFCAKTLLKWAVMFMGIRISLSELQALGFRMFFLVLLSVGIVLLCTFLLQWTYKKNSGLIWLIGFGTAICGSAAIAATSPFVKKEVEDMGTSIAIVNLLGIIGIFLLPTLSSFLIFEPFQSGLWVGSTLQAVGHVAASGEMIGLQGGEFAIAVKMGRVFCLLPLVLWLGFFSNGSQSSGSHEQSILQKIQNLWYLWGFIFFIFVNLYPVPELHSFIKNISSATLVIAMVGIGLLIDIKNIWTQSKLAIFYAGILWLFQILSCGVFVYFLT